MATTSPNVFTQVPIAAAIAVGSTAYADVAIIKDPEIARILGKTCLERDFIFERIFLNLNIVLDLCAWSQPSKINRYILQEYFSDFVILVTLGFSLLLADLPHNAKIRSG
jgi:hypothetical protein